MSIYAQNIIDYKYQLVNEAYFGKNETFLEMEKQIGIIREKALSKFTDINRSPEVLKLNRLFEKQFGMDVFALHVEKSEIINAYTIPVALNFDIALNTNLSKMVVADKQNGYRFKEGNDLCIICNVYLGLLKSPEITNGEIIAVILHELGHNFADAIYKNIYVANQKYMIQYYRQLIWATILSLGILGPRAYSIYKKNTNKQKNKENKKTHKRFLQGLFSGIKSTYSDFNMYINEVLARLSGSFDKSYIDAYIKNAEKSGYTEKVKKSLGRQNEVIADRFCGVYGYGPEQASVLVKMTNISTNSKAAQTVENIPIIGKQANKDYDSWFDVAYKIDEHPHVIQRLNEEIKLLEVECAKADIDPKLVKVMKSQIKQLEELRDKITTVTDDMTEKQMSQAEVYNNINSMDPDAVDEEIENAIIDAFDSIIK